MTLEKATHIIEDNYLMKEKSLCLFLYDECVFSVNSFWDLYNAISVVTRESAKDKVFSAKIAVVYQRVLKEIIYHFDPNDVAVINHFPENYHDYIERLDLAVRAYLENRPEWLDDSIFALQINPTDT